MTRRIPAALCLALLGAAAPAGAAPSNAAPARVLVEYFYAAGCDECRDMDETVLPALRELMGEWMDFRAYDIYAPAHYRRLAAIQERLGVRGNDRVSACIDGRLYLGGLPALRERLLETVEAVSLEQSAPGAPPPAAAGPPAPGRGAGAGPPADSILRRRLAAWSVPAVMAAGLIDGVNPCAFATLIFFVTLLAVAGKRGKALLAAGIGFCSAAFVTYGLLGFGVFHALKALAAHRAAGELLRWLAVAVLAVFAAASFRDAWAFRRTGRAAAMALQLPAAVRALIHRLMRTRLTSRGVLAASVSLGVLVTLLESVCTGQMYVPTLVYLARHTDRPWPALRLLALYNLMFLVPQVLVFAAAYRGATNARLLAWSRNNVARSKLLLGAGFAVLAALLAWL
jgi:hypothetical protein